MAATKNCIENWFDRGIKSKDKYLIVVCDTFEYEDYPVYAFDEDSCREKIEYFKNADMSKVMEVYDLSKDKEWQLNQPRAWNV